MISFVVSAYNNIDALMCCLYSLKCQTVTDWEAIVMHRDPTPRNAAEHRITIERLNDHRIKYQLTVAPGLYEAAEEGAAMAKGDWVCFPSDDSYYVPQFIEIVLKTARDTNADLVYADMVYDSRWNGRCYSVLESLPACNFIDKTSFVLKKTWLRPFPSKVPAPERSPSDGLLIDELVKDGIRHAKAPGILLVHN